MELHLPNTALTQNGYTVDFAYEVYFNGFGNVDLAMTDTGKLWIPEFRMTLTPTSPELAKSELLGFIAGFQFRPGEAILQNNDLAIEAQETLQKEVDAIAEMFNAHAVHYNSRTTSYILTIRQVSRPSYRNAPQETAIDQMAKAIVEAGATTTVTI